MEEAQELSHHIAIMDQGQVIAEGTHDELVRIVGEFDRVELTVSGNAAQAAAALAEHSRCSRDHAGRLRRRGRRRPDGERRRGPGAGQFTLLVEDSDLVLPRLFESVAGDGARITSVSVQEPNLEAVFLHLTGRALRDA